MPTPDTNAAQENAPDPRHARAKALAAAMPLVHFPASARLDTWSTSWGNSLKSHATLGIAYSPGDFGALRGTHVFTYAGPPCYYKSDSVGDSVLYFAPLAENSRIGGATPFDSGSLEPPDARLQPWVQKPVEERWGFFEQCSMPLAGWRDRFASWLASSYDNPERYVETIADRYAAGQPDRLEPPELLEHNGTRGRETYGPGRCADRRAWTWEVRLEGELPFENVRALHVPARRFRRAREVARRMRWSSGFIPEVKTLDPEMEATPDTLYMDSERVLKELVG